MASPFARTHALPGGPPVRLRLARRSDAPAVRELLVEVLRRRAEGHATRVA
jgi:hypothetical protein